MDILIHNAGAGQHAAAMDTTLAVDEMIFKTNCLSSIRLIKTVVPLMLKGGKGEGGLRFDNGGVHCHDRPDWS